MRLLIATTNQDKLREIRRLLGAAASELMSLADLPRVEEPEETGTTFEDNARLKAKFYDRHARQHTSAATAPRWTVAEDSGLVIDALNGEPGVHSARFVRADATYAQRFDEIYRRLRVQASPRPWRARFVCAICVVDGDSPVFETRGVVEGEISEAPSGAHGFGYDPIFYFPDYGKTLAEVAEEEKLSIAHRGHAFRALARWLSEPHPY